MLLAMLIDGETLKINIAAWSELWLHWTRDIDGRLHSQFLHSVFHHGKLDGNNSSHLDSTANYNYQYIPADRAMCEQSLTGNFSITLREVQIANAELCSLDMDWQIYLTATTQILNVTVSAVLRAAGNCSRTLLANFLFDVVSSMADMYALRIRWKSNDTTHVLTSADEFGFPLIPDLENLVRRCTA